MEDKPYQERGGGSYVVERDGSLRKVEGTEPAKPAAAKTVKAPAPLPPAEPKSEKGK